MRAPIVLVTLLAACGPSVSLPDSGDPFAPDAGLDRGPPPPPVLDEVPAAISTDRVSLRGRAPWAHRVVIEGGASTAVERVLPDGGFCVDVVLPRDGVHRLSVWAQDDAGRFSATPVVVEVVLVPDGRPDLDPPLCDGAARDRCAASEDCANGVDDDCDGLADAADPACSDCPVDPLEPNDDLGAPRVEPGRYSELAVCDGDVDVLPVRARAGQRLRVTMTARSSSGLLGARIRDLGRDRVVAADALVGEQLTLDADASEDGIYTIEVHGFDGGTGRYDLLVELR